MGDKSKQKQFAQKLHLNFPLINDRDGSIARKFGVYWKKMKLAKRSFVVANRGGTISYIDRDVSMKSFSNEFNQLKQTVDTMHKKQQKEDRETVQEWILSWSTAKDNNETEKAQDLLQKIQKKGRIARELLNEKEFSDKPGLKKHASALKEKLQLPVAVLKTTEGTIEVKLFEDSAPNTVANFITLAEKDFYKDVLFHRVIKGFMIQGGDPEGTGRGGPGYSIPSEISSRTHEKGVLSMANSGLNTAGSQFFITLDKQPHLDGKHTVFGTVTGGMDVVNSIGNVPTDGNNRPEQEVKIKRVEIQKKRNHDYNLQKVK